MKTPSLIFASLLTGTALSSGAVGYFGNFYVILDTGTGNTFFQTLDANVLTNSGGGFGTSSDGVNPAFTSVSLGTFDPTIDTLDLEGFEMNTFNDSGDSVDNATVVYTVSVSGGGSVASGNVTLNSPTSSGGNNKFWQVTNADVDLLSGLANGDYELSIWVENDASFTGGGGGTFEMANWKSSGQPTATFTVVPEPSVALLGGLGLLGLLRRRR